MATPTQPSFIPEPWAETSGNYDTIPATQQETGRASWENGFPLENTIPVAEGGTPSHYLDFQGVLNALSSFAWWQQRGGQFTWSQDLEYPVGAFVLGSDGNLYKSIQASSPSDPQDPTTATAYWTIADPTAFLPLSGGTMTGDIQSGESLFVIQKTNDSGTLIVRGGSDYGNGANLYLRGKDHDTQPGWLYGHIVNDGGYTDLFMKPDGTFTWGAKNVELVDSIGSGYIRYKSGLQICWGSSGISEATSKTYPKAFSETTPTIVASSNGAKAWASSVTVTGFTANLDSYSGSANFRYIAIGTWA